MLRAEAAVFTPQEPLAEKDTEKGNGTAGDEECSTVAPSPELTANGLSPMLSPFWGFEECTPEAMWAAAAMYGGYVPDGCYMPDLTLPEGQEGDIGYGTYEPQLIDEFTLEGLDDFESNLAGYLEKVTDPAIAQGDDSTQPKNRALTSPPPGLAPPPGLEDLPGLDLDDVGVPPGLGKTTVAELHARMGKPARGRAATWQAGEPEKKASPLPYGTTTAMLRNIPNKYSQIGLVERLHDGGYLGELDFIYLPIDFKNKCNVGYAFMNFRTAEACARFAAEFHLSNSRDKLPGFNSKKVCEVSAARYQGCEENIRRLQSSSVMPELVANPDWLPMLFDENGKPVEFPVGNLSAKESARKRGSLSKGTK